MGGEQIDTVSEESSMQWRKDSQVKGRGRGPQYWVRIHEKRCSSHRSTPAQLLWQVRGVCSAPQDKPDVHTLIFCFFSKCQDAACNLVAKKLKRKTLALST